MLNRFSLRHILVIPLALLLYLFLLPSESEQVQPEFDTAPIPYILPTFDEQQQDFRIINKPKKLEVEQAFITTMKLVQQCFPVQTEFDKGIEDLPKGEHAIRNIYIPIKAGIGEKRLALMEANIRLRIVDTVEALFKAVSHHHHKSRQLQLYKSLEKRSQVRVMKGVTGLEEQTAQLDKVVQIEIEVEQARIEANSKRVALLSMCSKGKSTELDNYIRGFIK